jgi:hypothetical protein
LNIIIKSLRKQQDRHEISYINKLLHLQRGDFFIVAPEIPALQPYVP